MTADAAAPARRTGCRSSCRCPASRGFGSQFTCSELDPLPDEAVDYALRLMWTGVSTGLHAFAGTCHGFDAMLPDGQISERLFEMQGAALRRALLH